MDLTCGMFGYLQVLQSRLTGSLDLLLCIECVPKNSQKAAIATLPLTTHPHEWLAGATHITNKMCSYKEIRFTMQ